jgi:hypothetical protein
MDAFALQRRRQFVAVLGLTSVSEWLEYLESSARRVLCAAPPGGLLIMAYVDVSYSFHGSYHLTGWSFVV